MGIYSVGINYKNKQVWRQKCWTCCRKR